VVEFDFEVRLEGLDVPVIFFAPEVPGKVGRLAVCDSLGFDSYDLERGLAVVQVGNWRGFCSYFSPIEIELGSAA
jgi:hypothetical protein